MKLKSVSMIATAAKTSVKKWIRAAQNFFPPIPSRSICQMLANFSGVEFYKTQYPSSEKKI